MSTNEEVLKCIEVLEQLVNNGAGLTDLPKSQREALMAAAGRLSRPARMELRLRNRHIDQERRKRKVSQDRKLRKTTGIREARRESVYQAPKQIEASHEIASEELANPRSCYVCKKEFRKIHFFYDSMCSTCADFNYKKRFQKAPLDEQVALITGARLKIGYQAALMLLRAGATVVVTTRFPVDAANRFSREDDFLNWSYRLQVHGLDLRHIPSVELFTQYISQQLPRLDILINNAAQTVRRPPGFYQHLLNAELQPYENLEPSVQLLLKSHNACAKHLASQAQENSSLPVSWQSQGLGIGIRSSAKLSQIPYTHDHTHPREEIFPSGKLDADLQQVDLRETNSWRLGLSEVSTPEMLEVQLVNSIAPFVICSRLAPLMRQNPTGQKHIVNVTAMEGKFTRYTKTDRHPHTNMAKAALNMMTLTSSKDLSKDGIYMNAVDTGWVTDEDPAALSLRKQENHDFQPPLDIVDGAARICDPIFDGILTGQHWCGKFLKDYVPTEW